MRLDQLSGQLVQRMEPGGVDRDPSATRLVAWGIHGGNDYITALVVNDITVARLSADPITGAARESVDALRIRVRRTVVPTLPPSALRDSKGSAVGYFVYQGLPADYCRAKALEEGAR